MKSPTHEYTVYDQVFAHFNHVFFNNQLPLCLITLQRKRHAYGYYSAKRFMARSNGIEQTDEIALNLTPLMDVMIKKS